MSGLKKGCFVTGTDTDVGKTLVVAALLHKYRECGVCVVGMKPVAAGCLPGSMGNNPDVAMLNAASSLYRDVDEICPYLFHDAIAPHLAASSAGVYIDMVRIVECANYLRTLSDALVVEGAGGFLVPLNDTCNGGDLARAIDLPLILVVGMRLGCLNHALLTQEAIIARGLPLAGWVANCIVSDMKAIEENVETLRRSLTAPLLGIVPYMPHPDPGLAAAYLSWP